MSNLAKSQDNTLTDRQPGIKIRDLELSDYSRVSELYYEFDNVHYKLRPDYYKEPSTPARSKEFFLNAIYNPYKRIIVAECDGVVLGFAHITISEAFNRDLIKARKTLSVHDIIVDNNHPAGSVSQVLGTSILSYAREMNCHDIVADSDFDNTVSHKFMNKFGLRPVNIRLQLVLGLSEEKKRQSLATRIQAKFARIKIKCIALFWHP